MGIQRRAFVDATADGVRSSYGFERFPSLEAFLSQENGPLVAFTPDGDVDIRDLSADENTWLVFGPAMGLPRHSFNDRAVTWTAIPGNVLNSRDAVPIALWEVSSWRAQ